MAQRIVFTEKGKVELQSYGLPDPKPEEIGIRTQYSLISIGSETTILHQRYATDSHFAQRFSFPQLKTGVQAVGVVEQLGSAVSEFVTGDRVFMRMAHGSHQVLPATACSPVPDAIRSQDACWCGLAKTAFRAAWCGGFEKGGEVLIVGAGPVGQMLVRWAASLELQAIAVIDLSALRLQHALHGGATHILTGEISSSLSQICEISGAEGPALVVDTTGNPTVFQQALGVLALYGKLVLLGDTGFPAKQCLSSAVMTKGLTIQATHDSHDRDGWTQQRIDQLFFSKVAGGQFDLSGLITHQFLPAQCAQAYELADQQRQQAMGILFDWTDR